MVLWLRERVMMCEETWRVQPTHVTFDVLVTTPNKLVLESHQGWVVPIACNDMALEQGLVRWGKKGLAITLTTRGTALKFVLSWRGSLSSGTRLVGVMWFAGRSFRSQRGCPTLGR
jgi:hypothetical protein